MVHQHHHDHQRAVFAMKIPSSTPECIIFPYDKPNKRFNFSHYSPIQTKDQFSIDEIQDFLDQVADPVREWHEKYGYLFDGSPKLCFFLITSFILMPLVLIFACWLSSAQRKALEKHARMTENTRIFMRGNQEHFLEQGFMWNIPADFPLWIELWTKVGGSKSRFSARISQLGFGGFQPPGIQMMSMSQENYQKMGITLQNQYDKTPMYGESPDITISIQA